MKFTKENVEKVIDEYFRQAGLEPCSDLITEIHNLDDTPEKVVVPKFVADYLEERKRDGDGLVTSLYPYQGNSGEAIEDWFEEEENNVSFAKAWIDGYTIEPEQLYHVVNKEGRFMLKRYDNGVKPTRVIATLNELTSASLDDFRLTEKEIKGYDGRYWSFAVPVEVR